MMTMMTIIMNDADLTSLIESSSSIQSWIQSSDMPLIYPAHPFTSRCGDENDVRLMKMMMIRTMMMVNIKMVIKKKKKKK